MQGNQSHSRIPPLDKLIKASPPIPDVILILDPGDTSGMARFREGQLESWGELKRDFAHFEHHITEHVDLIVCESYRVYAHKAQQHVHSDVPTLRLIGVIEYLAWKLDIPIVWQSASEAKGFITDDKLQAWDMYKKESRHARDAIRHGLYYLITRKA